MSAFFSGPPSIFTQARWKRPKREYSAPCAARSSTWEVSHASRKHSTIDSRGGNAKAVWGRPRRTPASDHSACAWGACTPGGWRFGSVVAEHEPCGSLASRNQIGVAQGQRADGRIEALGRNGCDRSWPDRYRFGPDQRRHFRPVGDGRPVSVDCDNSGPTIWISPPEAESGLRASEGKRLDDAGANQKDRAEPGRRTGAGASANIAGCGNSETTTGRATH